MTYYNNKYKYYNNDYYNDNSNDVVVYSDSTSTAVSKPSYRKSQTSSISRTGNRETYKYENKSSYSSNPSQVETYCQRGTYTKAPTYQSRSETSKWSSVHSETRGDYEYTVEEHVSVSRKVTIKGAKSKYIQN